MTLLSTAVYCLLTIERFRVSSQYPGDKTLTARPGATIRYVANVPEIFPNLGLKKKLISNQVWARGELLKEFRRKPFNFPLNNELLRFRSIGVYILTLLTLTHV